MNTDDTPVARDVVLVGGGHSHAGVLRMFGMRPQPGVRLTLVCTDTHTPYSGMLPGYIAGHYTHDEVHIDLRRLCAWAGVRYIHGEAVGIDRARRQLLLRDRPPLAYDLLSINIGATPRMTRVAGGAEHAVPVKPIARFNDRWLALLDRVRAHAGPMTLAVVGGGAGGVEMTLAMQWRLARELRAADRDPASLHFHLLTSDAHILPTHNVKVRAAFEHLLAERGVHLHVRAEVTEVQAGRLRAGRALAVGQPAGAAAAPASDWLDADEIVFVTHAGGAGWLADTGLALNADGFVRVDTCLRSISDPAIYAAGDVAHMDAHPREKAGVFAVRQARPLARNLRLAAAGREPLPYWPQKRWLALISTGDRHAVASRGALYLRGDWVWKWKDWIDRRFMRRLSVLPPMEPPLPAASPVADLGLRDEEARQAISALAMRCGGCGAKVGADLLSRALAELRPLRRDDVLVGLDTPDDAAVLSVPTGMALVHSVDFFRAFVDDPYVFGRVAANHALGDLFAMGAQPHSATAIVTVPPGLDAKVEDLLRQLMGGAVDQLNAAGCALVGGHTAEGKELALGFAVNGLVAADMRGVLRKGGMRVGDALVLTKPLGTGVLFAANPLGQARGRWIDAALASMMQSNQAAARCLAEHGASACTDVTGFGLVGHLLEMTRASGVDARLSLAALPLLDGAQECAAQGIASSLQPANERLRGALGGSEHLANDPRRPLLFDPQTAGGLLASVDAGRAEACVAELRGLGYAQAAVIGQVLARTDAPAPIALTD